MNDFRKINISTGTMLRAILLVFSLWVLYVAREVVALFFLSIIFTATLDPVIDLMQRKKIPRTVSVSLVYIGFFVILGTALSLLAPPFLSQVKDFAEKFPIYSEKLATSFAGIEVYARSYGMNFNISEMVRSSLSGMTQSSGQIFSTTVGIFTVLLSIVIVLSLTFYMSVKEDGMKKFVLSFTPRGKKDYVISLVERIQKKIGRWMFGQLILMLIIFVLDFIALSIFGIPYALILALLAGILEIVPYLGPIISATLAAIVGFIISPMTGIIILCVLTLIQQLESHIIVPQIMKKAVGLNPVVVILSLLIGAKLGGTMGAILSIPVATAIGIFVEDFASSQRD
jgi:predicted PurR-regulated permease PerM